MHWTHHAAERRALLPRLLEKSWATLEAQAPSLDDSVVAPRSVQELEEMAAADGRLMTEAVVQQTHEVMRAWVAASRSLASECLD